MKTFQPIPMGHFSVALSAMFLAVASSARAQDRVDNRPNIILFMVDDMGWQDTSLPFWTQRTMYNDRYETPNMERLAARGMMFSQAYACPISSPSRCSLMTGSNAARHRVTNWTLEKNKSTDLKDDQLTLPEWNYNGISGVEGCRNTYRATSFVNLLPQVITPYIAERRIGVHGIRLVKIHITGDLKSISQDMRAEGLRLISVNATMETLTTLQNSTKWLSPGLKNTGTQAPFSRRL